jgi:hypothetical protein
MTDMGIEYPDDIVGPKYEKSIIFGGGYYLRKRPWHNQFAYCSDSGHWVETIKYDENMQVTQRNLLFDLLPEYSVNGGKARKSDSCLSGLSLTVSENLVYVGDDNLTMGDYRKSDSAPMEKNGYPAGFSKTVYVFDWDGNAIARYELDKAVIYCSVDKNDEYLYAFAFNEETYESDLVRFRLPALGTGGAQ